jgi:hypothetical protein
VTGRTDELCRPEGPPASPPPVAEDVAVAVVQPIEVSQPLPAADPPQPIQVSPPRIAGDFRTEVQARVANFRKHQERFEREREEYCAATLDKLRAAIRDAFPQPPVDKL